MLEGSKVSAAVVAGSADAPAPKRRLYYGWVMVPVAVAGVVATSPGQTYGIAAFNPSLRADLGLSHSQLTGAYMLGTLLAALPLALVGRMMDLHGLRKTLAVTVCLLGLACVVAAAAQGPITVFLAFFLLRMLGPGAVSLLSSSTLSFWFDRRLGTVEGVGNLSMAAAGPPGPELSLREATRTRAFWIVIRPNSLWALVGTGVTFIIVPIVTMQGLG